MGGRQNRRNPGVASYAAAPLLPPKKILDPPMSDLSKISDSESPTFQNFRLRLLNEKGMKFGS